MSNGEPTTEEEKIKKDVVIEPRHQALSESQIAAAPEQHPAFQMSKDWGVGWNEQIRRFE